MIIISHLSSVSAAVCQRSGLSAEGGLSSVSTAVCQPKAVSTLSAQRSVSDSGLFDLVFIDADKREYCAYLDLVYPLLPVGGFILADNTLWDGHIIDPAYDKDKQTLGLRAFNDRLAADERFEKVILPLRDGLTLIRKIQ